jgi:hypothetical protein
MEILKDLLIKRKGYSVEEKSLRGIPSEGNVSVITIYDGSFFTLNDGPQLA